jgi:cytochrome c oxidase cbb3-type subunit III
MSDFTSTFWSIFIATVTLAGILACLVLLLLTGKAKPSASGDNTTGHVFDGDLRELNNPLPRWWMWLFILSIVFGLIYLTLYPGLGNFEGTLAWSSRAEHQSEVDQSLRDIEPLYAKFRAMSPEAVSQNPQATGIGERLFLNQCAQCHGSDARGNKGFPNLTDNDWLHGGNVDQIKTTLTQGRIGMMPPMAAAVGSAEDVRNVAHYVLSLSGSRHESVRAAAGQAKFAACAACHGADGKGNIAIGAPNLTDNIWLHGAGEAAIVAMIQNGKTNQMPAQADKLSADQIHLLTAYVWGLSHPFAAK